MSGLQHLSTNIGVRQACSGFRTDDANDQFELFITETTRNVNSDVLDSEHWLLGSGLRMTYGGRPRESTAEGPAVSYSSDYATRGAISQL
jgi:hypothetical protein